MAHSSIVILQADCLASLIIFLFGKLFFLNGILGFNHIWNWDLEIPGPPFRALLVNSLIYNPYLIASEEVNLFIYYATKNKP